MNDYTDITYQVLKEWDKANPFPATGESKDGETLIFEKTHNDDGEIVYRVSIVQNNNWICVHYYHEDGTVEEMFER